MTWFRELLEKIGLQWSLLGVISLILIADIYLLQTGLAEWFASKLKILLSFLLLIGVVWLAGFSRFGKWASDILSDLIIDSTK